MSAHQSPPEAQLGCFAIANALLAGFHYIPARPFDAGWPRGFALVRFGASRILGARLVAVLGTITAAGFILIGGWQIVIIGSTLIGVWLVIVGLLVARTLMTDR
jgi:hypothetical protein